MVVTAVVAYYCMGVLVTIAATLGAVWLSLHFRLALNKVLLVTLCLSSVYLSVFQYLKYRSLHFYADFSHWAQLLYTIANTGKPFVQNVEFIIPGSLNYLSVHFVPLTYALAGIFKLFPFAGTIIILNFLIMASSVIPLYKISLQFHKDRFFALFMSLLLLWYPVFQYTVLYEFEVLRFSIPIILWMLLFWKKKRLIAYYLTVALAVLIREEIGLTIALFGIYVFLSEKKRLHGVLTALIGAGSFLAIFQIIMPLLRQGASYSYVAANSFRNYGTTPGEILNLAITHPMLFAQSVFDPVKLANIFMFFLPLLFVPLLAYPVLFSCFAVFGAGLLSDSYTHSSFMLHYLSATIPFIFYAFIQGWPLFISLLKRISQAPKIKGKSEPCQIGYTLIFTALIMTNVFFGPSFLSLQFWFKNIRPAPFHTQDFHYSAYKVTRHHRELERFVKQIPDSAIVSTQQFLSPRLYRKKGVLIFPDVESKDGKWKADYILFDVSNNELKPQSPAFIKSEFFSRIALDKQNWELIDSEDNYFLYKRILPLIRKPRLWKRG